MHHNLGLVCGNELNLVCCNWPSKSAGEKNVQVSEKKPINYRGGEGVNSAMISVRALARISTMPWQYLSKGCLHPIQVYVMFRIVGSEGAGERHSKGGRQL